MLGALASPSVREAAASPHWREVYACTPIDGRLLEGYIDLLYRDPEGLVVVDYKTAATSDEMVTLMNQGGFDLVTASGDGITTVTTWLPSFPMPHEMLL